MTQFAPATVLAPALIVGAALALGGCGSMTTYGTGTTAAAQTVEDITGILSLGDSKETPIEYEARAPIVEPPAATLPLPGSGDPVAVANNWPVDPDAERERIDALVEERAASGQSLKFTVPESAESKKRPVAYGKDDDTPYSRQVLSENMRRSSNPDETKKIFADAKMAKTGSFDQDGNPVRRYLVEPPAAYRQPDAESPIDITEKPKKKGFKWPDLWPF